MGNRTVCECLPIKWGWGSVWGFTGERGCSLPCTGLSEIDPSPTAPGKSPWELQAKPKLK